MQETGLPQSKKEKIPLHWNTTTPSYPPKKTQVHVAFLGPLQRNLFLECPRVWFSLSKLSPNNKADEHHTPSHSESSDYKRLSSSQRAQMSKDWTSRHLQKQREGMLSGSLTNWSEWLTWRLAPPSSKQLLYIMLHCSKGGFTPAVCVWDACVCNVCVACVCVWDVVMMQHAMHVCDV